MERDGPVPNVPLNRNRQLQIEAVARGEPNYRRSCGTGPSME